MNVPLPPALAVVSPPILRTGSNQNAYPTQDRGADEAVVAGYGLLVKGHCRRVYRVVRSVLRNPAEIEDVMSQTFVSTFMHTEQIDPIREPTWVCRMALNEALVRIRQRGRFVSLERSGTDTAPADKKRIAGAEAVTQTSDMDIVAVYENAVDGYPEIYRTVLIMRDVEGMTVGETAATLNVDVETVKVRLEQGRHLLRGIVAGYAGDVFQAAFPLQDELGVRVNASVTDALRWMLRLSDRERGPRPSPVASSARATTGRA